jgi:hypothetical protein
LPWDQYPRTDVPAQQTPIFADFTGDGIPDRLTAVFGDVAVRPGLGDGTFGDPIYSYVPTSGGGFFVADFNDDGRLDLYTSVYYVASDYSPLYGVLLLGQGDGTFYFEQGVPLMDTVYAGGAGDFNGDGRPDVAFAGTDYGGEPAVVVGLNDGKWDPTAGQPRFVISGFPSSITAGTAGAFTVTATDAASNTLTDYAGTAHGAVHFISSDPQAVLPDDYTFTPADQGVHTFYATFTAAGWKSITVLNDPWAHVAAGTQEDIYVNPAPASLIRLGFSYSATAGVAGNLSIVAYDPYGNLGTGYTGTVHFTSSDAQAVLPADYTFTAADAGWHTFSATLNTVGTQSLTATDLPSTGISDTHSGITVTPAASSFAVSGFPSSITAGTAGTFTVTARDAAGNTLTDYAGTVHFTSSDPQAGLPDYTFTKADQGVHTFYAILKTAGMQSLTVIQSGTAVTGTQSGITVSPAAASTFAVTGFPSPVTAGVAGSFTVTARDPYGNRATGYTGAVHFSSSDARAALPGNYTFSAGDAGTHTFSATLKTAGSQSLTATDTVNPAITGAQGSIRVTPAVASRLILSAPASMSANAQFNLTVTVVDAYGNVVTGYRGTLSFSSSDLTANLPKKYTFTAADQGVHTFTGLRLKKKGKQTITVTDTLNSSLKGSAIIDVL